MQPLHTHIVIPDTQVKPGVPTDHLTWIGRLIREVKPTLVVHLGDHWDFPSLSRHDAPGSLAKEGARVEDDIAAGNQALQRLQDALGKWKGRKVILRGNHEHRLQAAINDDPRLAGALGYHLLNDTRLGWEVIEYFNGAPGQVMIDGVVYGHYFAGVNTGRAIGGTAANKLNHIGDPFVQGHVQGFEIGTKQYSTGKVRQGVVAGSCYLHDEDYKGMANTHWRGVVILNEIQAGKFDVEPIRLDTLCRKYEGQSLGPYLRRKYRHAEQRFTLARRDA